MECQEFVLVPRKIPQQSKASPSGRFNHAASSALGPVSVSLQANSGSVYSRTKPGPK